MPYRSTPPTTVRAVERALDILLCFTKSTHELSLSEIARDVGLHKSTAHRLLLSLQQKGFVRRQQGSDKYMLGWSALCLSANAPLFDSWTSIALPVMTELRDHTGETVSLYVRSGIERIRVQAVESREPIRNVATVGERYPLYIGASGKVLLAWSDIDLINEILRRERLPSGFSLSELRSQLVQVRTDGYAVSFQERDAGAAAMAAPVFGPEGDCIAALAVSGPVSRLTEAKMEHSASDLMGAAATFSQAIANAT
ncbi:IclR family transcriptional regulator [Alicyclobacillus sacchari]|uniref:IclR family transcriptional regulator n=1 Tax=Alicyclobacillus sacchari TaxID=392010 RepID=UPI001065D9AA|nr:IclR family transcriptional regulator [Alicyclobacillus sacchari]GMA57892.1 IclR family transcriptional regulator [Alicyclobacillus sacchari]